MNKITPIISHNGIYIKQDYKFRKDGLCGTRGRMAYAIMKRIYEANYSEVVFACNRDDIDLALVAQASQVFGSFGCDIFTPTGAKTDLMNCMEICNPNVVYHQVANGYSNVLNARARDYAYGGDRAIIPMGMVCHAAVETVMHQCKIIPADVKRIVVYDESGVIVAGIMAGLSFYGRSDIDVTGITTKREPYGVVEKLIGVDLLDKPQVTFWFKREAQTKTNDLVDYNGIKLFQSDAHCVKHLAKGDMFWVCGNSIA